MSSNYQVLARKYRPQTFADLMGQDVLVKTLKNAIEHHRIPHAILLTGVRGIGKTTTARLIARSLNCIGRDGKGSETITPCGVCQNCTDILEDRHLDVIEMDAASRTSVDDIRKVIDTAYYKPSSARYKVQIIDEVHMLTKQAFNALLKTLEEPPEYTKFIFATTELHRVPDTIISRCVRFDLKRFDPTTLKELLQKTCDQEKIKIEPEALSLLAQAANGSARDSQSLLERAISLSPDTVTDEAVRSMLGLTGQGGILDLFKSILQGESSTALSLFDGFYRNGADPDQILSALCDMVHEVSCLKISPSFKERSLLAKEQLEQLQSIAEQLSVPVLTRLWQVMTKGREELKGAPSAMQAAEMILIRTCYLSDLPTSQAVIAELAKQRAQDNDQGTTNSNDLLPDSADVAVPKITTPQKKNLKISIPIKFRNVDLETKAELPERTLVREDNDDLQFSKTTILKEDRYIGNFHDLVELFETNKEPLLKYEFENHVKLISLDVDNQVLEIALTKEIVTGFIKKSRDLLKKWTGANWDIKEKKILEEEKQGVKTLRVQRKEIKERLIDDAKETLLVKTALEVFPEAKICDVKLLKKTDK